MLSGVCVGTNNLETAGRLYDAVFATIGLKRIVSVDNEVGYGTDSGDVCFWVLKPFGGQAATFGNGTKSMFSTPVKENIRAFHATALQQGGSDEGAPGPRDYSEGYYGAYVRDLDGNKLHVFLTTK